ncbi:hypothetical protein [Streptomyces erythrochromogenes]|uniref:hypothetical protein n=1 Tax=Streptomyces erythrochromogenes TaxID=285574 RepID=UPI00224E5C08|nr:hypothetical protein [Streptomyces erythrochromogenes]MCX5584229.1 hypothetical protein [Streptomyces erythrochromogenes]
MTELAVHETAAAPAMPASQENESALAAWARDAAAISQVAGAIANTSLAGAYRGKRDEIVAVILAGHELGLQPMTSLKSIDVIQGQPALRAHAMRGLLQANGHEIELIESTDLYCKMRGRRKGAVDWQVVEWDIPRVQRMGLLGKDQWKKQPKTMLVARATGEISRLVASDALHGMPYAAEELDGYVHGELVQRQRAPLSVEQLVAGQPGPGQMARERQTGRAQRAAEPPVTDADNTSADEDDPVWENDDDPEPALWPAAAQPGAGTPHP